MQDYNDKTGNLSLTGRAAALRRCPWCGDDPLYLRYHDEEWGLPEHRDERLFEHLLLEGAQAGLSWITILRRREAYRRAFAGFDPERIACYDEGDVKRLLADAGIIRNRLKIQSAINNARRYLEVCREPGGFSRLLWSFVDGRPQQNCWARIDQVPASTPVSSAMSSELKRRGFSFVGPTSCYALMQSCGLVNDHLQDCFRHQACARA